MRRWLRRQSRKWYAYWDLLAAKKAVTELGYRESNGHLVLPREWLEAEEWLLRAREEYDAARGLQDG